MKQQAAMIEDTTAALSAEHQRSSGLMSELSGLREKCHRLEGEASNSLSELDQAKQALHTEQTRLMSVQ